MFRFIINPLFLFSGTFFPVTQLPDPIEALAAATPLYHGVALVRGTILNDAASLAAWPIHVGYLVAFFMVSAFIAHALLRRRLVK
jgi:lipooligosaccharide transport system permease protein